MEYQMLEKGKIRAVLLPHLAQDLWAPLPNTAKPDDDQPLLLLFLGRKRKRGMKLKRK